MYVPGLSKRSSKTLEKRKGGGGGGRGGGGRSSGGRSSGRGSGRSSGGGGSGPQTRPIQSSSGFAFGGQSRSASAYGRGGGASTIIPAGTIFAGRSIGGGSRDTIYGTRAYGSGYGTSFLTRGVAGRPFPFFFWPLVWGTGTLLVTDTYLNARDEYGAINNSTRPGGPLATTLFQSSSGNTTFRIMADNATVVSLVSDISTNCSSRFSTNPLPTPSLLDTNATTPRPEQVIQYYRASSIALTLDGYNNSATYGSEGTPDTPLPLGIDNNLLNCLNGTIAAAAPLVDGGFNLCAPSYFNLIGLVWILWALLKFH